MDAGRLVAGECGVSGVDSLDQAHLELADLYNRIAAACEERQPLARIRERLRVFFLYAQWHFADEEEHMREAGYPGLVEHKREHDRLLQDASDFLENLRQPFRPEDAPAIAKYFRFWLSRHLADHDRALGRFLRSRPHAAPAQGTVAPAPGP